MRFPIVSLFAAALSLSAVAHADTINFASAPGVTTYTYISGQGSNNGASGVSVAYPNSAYGTAIAGSSWVSTDSNGGNGAIGATNYTNSVVLLANENYTGSLTFMADDAAGVFINGVQVYALNNASSYTSPTTISLLSTYFKSGANTVTVQDYNTGGPAAADFAGSITGAAVTPEPSSLVLLGTGALGLMGQVRRRLRKA